MDSRLSGVEKIEEPKAAEGSAQPPRDLPGLFPFLCSKTTSFSTIM